MKLLTPAEVADRLHRSVHTLANWRASGKGPPFLDAGGILYPESELENWLESRVRRTNDAPQKQRRDVALPVLLDGHEYTGSTGLVATERNRSDSSGAEVEGSGIGMSGRSHELKLQVKPFSDAAAEFLVWAMGEYSGHTRTAPSGCARALRACARFFGNTPVSAILRGHVNDYKAWRRREHEVARSPSGTICTRFRRPSVTGSTTTGRAKIQLAVSAASRSPATKTRSEFTYSPHLRRECTLRRPAGIRRSTTSVG